MNKKENSTDYIDNAEYFSISHGIWERLGESIEEIPAVPFIIWILLFYAVPIFITQDIIMAFILVIIYWWLVLAVLGVVSFVYGLTGRNGSGYVKAVVLSPVFYFVGVVIEDPEWLILVPIFFAAMSVTAAVGLLIGKIIRGE